MAFTSKFKIAANFLKKAYNKNLLVSNTLTTMTLLAAGDVMTQYIEIRLADPNPSKFNFGQSFLSSGMQSNKLLTHSIITVENNALCKSDESSFTEKCDWSRTGIL